MSPPPHRVVRKFILCTSVTLSHKQHRIVSCCCCVGWILSFFYSSSSCSSYFSSEDEMHLALVFYIIINIPSLIQRLFYGSFFFFLFENFSRPQFYDIFLYYSPCPSRETRKLHLSRRTLRAHGILLIVNRIGYKRCSLRPLTRVFPSRTIMRSIPIEF